MAGISNKNNLYLQNEQGYGDGIFNEKQGVPYYPIPIIFVSLWLSRLSVLQSKTKIIGMAYGTLVFQNLPSL